MKYPARVALLACLCSTAFAQEHSGVITGTVRSSLSKRALPSVRVELTVESTAEDDAASTASTLTGIQGGFQFENLPAGSATLRFEKSGYEARGTRVLRINLEPGNDHASLDVELNPSAAISGTVVDRDGDPVNGASVQLRVATLKAGFASFRGMRTVRTDDRGQYRLYELAPGEYYLSVVPAGGRSPRGVRMLEHSWGYYPGVPSIREAERIRVTWGTERTGVDLRLGAPPNTAISGLIRNVDDRGPCRSCEVVLTRPQEGRLALVVTDETGMFLLRGLHPGDYVLQSTALEGPRYNAVENVSITENHATQVDIVLQRGSVIRGRAMLVGADAEEIAAAGGSSLTVSLTSLNGYRSGRLRARPDLAAGGRFEIIDVAAGEYRLSLRGGPARSYLREISLGGRPMASARLMVNAGSDLSGLRVVIATDGVTVRGTVDGEKYADDGEAAPPGLVVLMPAEGVGGYRREYSGRYRSSDGRFEIPSVRPGSYDVFAIPSGHVWDLTDPIDLCVLRNAAETIKLRAGEDATVEVPFVGSVR